MPADKGLPKEFFDALKPAPDFETELGLLVHEWLMLISLDKVIEGLDLMVETLETRRDVEEAAKRQPPASEPRT